MDIEELEVDQHHGMIITTIKYKMTPREVNSLGVLFYSNFLSINSDK